MVLTRSRRIGFGISYGCSELIASVDLWPAEREAKLNQRRLIFIVSQITREENDRFLVVN